MKVMPGNETQSQNMDSVYLLEVRPVKSAIPDPVPPVDGRERAPVR